MVKFFVQFIVLGNGFLPAFSAVTLLVLQTIGAHSGHEKAIGRKMEEFDLRFQHFQQAV